MKRLELLVFILLSLLYMPSCNSSYLDEPPLSPEESGSEGKVKLSVLSNGSEILNDGVVTYYAHVDQLGNMAAGHNVEPLFITSAPCKLDVRITVPNNNLERIQWCGITPTCEDLNAGVHVRSVDMDNNKKSFMQLHAYFKKGSYASCKVEVEVLLNGKQERTFQLEYVYKEDDNDKESLYATPQNRSHVVAVEFTGQKCPNCPPMGRRLEELQKEYGKGFVIVAQHCWKNYSYSPSNMKSLYNADSESYANTLNINGLPTVTYNSMGTLGNSFFQSDMFNTPDLLECTGDVKASQETYKVTINIKTRLRNNRKDFVNGKNVNVLLWVLENEIIAPQWLGDTWDMQSPHKHVFRGCLNGIWGQSYDIGTVYSRSFELPKQDILNTENHEIITERTLIVKNAEILVLFLDADSHEILDAGLFPMKE